MPPAARYPTGGEYREALFNTSRCFKDPALVGGMVAVDPLGMPKPISGASGSVFTVRNADGRRWAVKCFTRSIDQQAARYERISETLHTVNQPWRVGFEYLPDGLLYAGIWYPILKMEWIEATSLIPFIEKHLWESEVILDLAGKFVQMVRDLSVHNIAHGDLQHGNLLITPSGELKLIDYDGMFVPALARIGACEKGHLNYQSPTRTMSTWGPYLDNFSAWVIYTSLIALTIDPTLWSLLHNPGDEALLFHHTDYEDPRSSRALLAFAQSSESALHALGTVMCNVWAPEVRAIPPLNPDDLPRLDRRSTSSAATSSRAASKNTATASRAIPDWVTDAQAVTRTAAPKPSNDSSWVTGHLPPLPAVAFSSPKLGSRILAAVFLVVILAVALSAGLGQLPGNAASAVAVLAILLFVVSTAILLRQTPEWRIKHEKMVIFRQCRTEASKMAREVAKWDAARREIDSREQKAVGKIGRRADEARAAEQKELADVNTRLASRIQQIQTQRSSLQSNEQKETANTLRLLQEQYVSTYLSRASIQSAKIAGIGPGIVNSLAANGVTTAADYTGITYPGGPRGGAQRVLIQLRNGNYVHPNGVGTKKAQALDIWRMTLERQARTTQPSRLPTAQAQAIRAKYLSQGQNLNNEEQAARARAPVERNHISQKWMPTHSSISAELSSTRQAFARERAQSDVQLNAAQRQANAATWQRDLAAREISANQGINYRRYLTGIIRSLSPRRGIAPHAARARCEPGNGLVRPTFAC